MQQVSVPAFVPTRTHELLHRMSGKGLAAHYHFSRQPCVYNDQMVSVQVTLANTTDQKIENIHLGEKKLPTGMKVHVFNPIGNCSIILKLCNIFFQPLQHLNFLRLRCIKKQTNLEPLIPGAGRSFNCQLFSVVQLGEPSQFFNDLQSSAQ